MFGHTNFPQDRARHARTSPVFRPTYTSPFATLGEDCTWACVPIPNPSQDGPHVGWPHPDAAKAARKWSEPMYTVPFDTAGLDSKAGPPMAPDHSGRQLGAPQPFASN